MNTTHPGYPARRSWLLRLAAPMLLALALTACGGSGDDQGGGGTPENPGSPQPGKPADLHCAP